MRSPVKRSVWIQSAKKQTPGLRLAGLSALGRLTQLADPPWPVYAMGPTEWRQAKLDAPELLPHPTDGCSEWQLWTYSPALVHGTRLVDPLSLTLSLESHSDERVQLALYELQKQCPW